jgi:hypothetical protein
MKRIKTVEFWLIALPVLFIVAVWAAGLERDFIPFFLGIWIVLAIFWMLREFVRKLRS